MNIIEYNIPLNYDLKVAAINSKLQFYEQLAV